MYLGRVYICWRGIEVIGCTDVIRWSCGRLGRSNRLGTYGGADSVIGRVVSRRWFGQTVMWVGDVHVVPWS